MRSMTPALLSPAAAELLDRLPLDGVPMCIDPTWPSYTETNHTKSVAIVAAEELYDRRVIAPAHGCGAGLWVRRCVTLGTRTLSTELVSRVLDSVSLTEARGLHDIARRSGNNATYTRHALVRLRFLKLVITTAGDTGLVYRRTSSTSEGAL